MQRRFDGARDEIAHYGLFDYVLVNDDLDDATEQADRHLPRRGVPARPRGAARGSACSPKADSSTSPNSQEKS